MGYSEEFDGFAADALNPDLPPEERAAALKAAIMACMDSGGEDGEEEEPKSSPKAGLALVFGGPKKKGG